MRTLVFFLEEPSAREMLKGLLSKLALDEKIGILYIVFEGKQDLEKNIQRKLSFWRLPDTFFIILRDQDSGDCQQIKSTLLDKCHAAKKQNDVLVRIACHELESWYLGDLTAVEKGLNISNLARQQGKTKYRSPDDLTNPSHELSILTKSVYQKVSGSRDISRHLDVRNNRSRSFQVFIEGIEKILGVQF